jgi:S1-C subfamily serine protease
MEDGLQLLQSLSDAISGLAEQVSPSVVKVEMGRWGGSGVVWDKEGHVVTANHVVGRRSSAIVELQDGRRLEAKILGRDPTSDIAVLKVEATGLKPIEVGDSQPLKSGQFVLALANSLGSRVNITSGIVTNPSRTIPGWWGVVVEDAVITDARLNPGYSGGPLVDASGKMIGMNVAYASSRGIAVPVNTLKGIASKLSREGKIRRSYLGIAPEPISLPKELSKAAKLSQDQGILVLSTEPGSPASKAGAFVGDIIVSIGDHEVANLYELHKALDERLIGKTVSLRVLRGGVITELKVTPEEAKEWNEE